MDISLALRLDSRSALYDSGLFDKLAKVARDYVTAGSSALDFYLRDFDICNDTINCYGPTVKTNFEREDRKQPRTFIHPMTATELWTLSTFVSQILFGGENARSVQPRNPEDEPKADIINELLRWNDNQQPTYTQGFHWCLDALNVNRGVMYDHWKDLFEVELEAVEYETPWQPPEVDDKGKPAIDPETGKRYKKPRNYKGEIVTRFRKKRVRTGGFVKIDLISPYDFICDPGFPLLRFQEGRFAGHRVLIPWNELQARSELPVDDYNYVLPAVVEKLKNSKNKKITGLTAGPQTSTSRSYWERQRRNQPVTAITGSDKIDKEDGGIVECFCIQVRCRPSTYDIFPEDNEEEKIEFLLSGESDLLSVNVMTNKHDQYPYSIGEGRPNAHQQFSPSWTMIIKGPQDYVDYLNRRHQESLARTSGNIFIGHPDLVDFEAFTDPNKDGLFIPLTELAKGKPISEIIGQVKVTDTTANFYNEMQLWKQTAEQASGAHANVQGTTEEGEQTATEYIGTQQMASGRISTLARLLSATALVPQTNRIVENLQQFLPDEMTIRITGEPDSFDPDKPLDKFMDIRRDASTWQDENGDPIPATDADGNPIIDPETQQPLPDQRALLPDIQGNFDVQPSDGALPGTDAKQVAALSRVLEVAASNPMLAPAFDQTKAGSINVVKLFQKLVKKTGTPTAGLIITKEEAAKNAQDQLLAQGGGIGMPASQAPQPSGAPIDPATGQPSAATLPPIPPATPPRANPAQV